MFEGNASSIQPDLSATPKNLITANYNSKLNSTLCLDIEVLSVQSFTNKSEFSIFCMFQVQLINRSLLNHTQLFENIYKFIKCEALATHLYF